jgi:hypothetical protein
VGAPIQGFISLLTLLIVITELVNHRRSRQVSPYPLGLFFGSFALLIAAATFSALDVTRKWCDPKDHVLQGHAVWHVLSAASLLVSFFHYRKWLSRQAA